MMTDLPLPVFLTVPIGKENTELARLVGSEEAFGMLQRRNGFCDRVEETLLQLHVAFLDLLKAQPAISSQQLPGVIPPHTQLAIESHSQSLALRAELLLQQIHELKVHAITVLNNENADTSEPAGLESTLVTNSGQSPADSTAMDEDPVL
jgi:hypothetical protein